MWTDFLKVKHFFEINFSVKTTFYFTSRK